MWIPSFLSKKMLLFLSKEKGTVGKTWLYIVEVCVTVIVEVCGTCGMEPILPFIMAYNVVSLLIRIVNRYVKNAMPES
uniref:Uncharacterized protein n=1 Tax=Arundo donax TaxID=35708 RepID=A0A0A9DQL1_ARUDO